MAAEVHPEIRVRYKYIVSMMAHEKLLEKSDSPPLFSRWPNHDHRDRGAQFLERGLTAILAANVIEYSRLMSEDQDSTLAAPRLLRTEIFGPVVEANGGMVVKRMGDGWIVEFASVADAVRCALHIQQALSDHEIIRLRMGIHTGDVVFEDEDVFGDGVNVAARLEELAVPGEVLISDTAHHSLDGKAAEQLTGGDSHQLKIFPGRCRSGAGRRRRQARKRPAKTSPTRCRIDRQSPCGSLTTSTGS